MSRQTKLLFTVFLILLTTFGARSQDQEFNNEVYRPDISKINTYAKEAYGKEKADGMNEMNKADFRDMFQNRLIITKLDNEPDDYTLLKNILAYNENLKQKKDFDPKTFNPLNYNMSYWNRENKEYYKVGNTGYYIILKKYNPAKGH